MNRDKYTQQWLDYLDGKLPEDEARRLEEEIEKSEFLREALQGLRPLAGKEDLRETTRMLNQQLQQQLAARKRVRHKPLTVPLLWVVAALVIILVVIFLGFYFYSRKP
jgi:anti-sigma factor RsiW